MWHESENNHHQPTLTPTRYLPRGSPDTVETWAAMPIAAQKWEKTPASMSLQGLPLAST